MLEKIIVIILVLLICYLFQNINNEVIKMKNKNKLLYDYMEKLKYIKIIYIVIVYTVIAMIVQIKRYAILQKMLLKILEIYTMRVNRNLLNYIQKIY